MVVAGGEVGVAGFAGFDGSFFPGAAGSAGFAELPEVVESAGPEGHGSILAAQDVIALGIGGDAAQEEEAAVGGVVFDAAIVRGDGADLGEASGAVRGQFVEGPGAVEEIAFGDDFAIDAPRSGGVEVGIAFGQAPAAAVFIFVKGGGGIDGDDAGGNGHGLAHECGRNGVVFFRELQVAVEFVVGVSAGDGEGVQIGSARI